MTCDQLLKASEGPSYALTLFKWNLCYYQGCTDPIDLYYSEELCALVCYCPGCASRNNHLRLEKLGPKEIFTLQTHGAL